MVDDDLIGSIGSFLKQFESSLNQLKSMFYEEPMRNWKKKTDCSSRNP